MAILSVLALLVFGEQKLPGIMRQAGRLMREVQNTSQSFIREMERAADVNEAPKPTDLKGAAAKPEPVLSDAEGRPPSLEGPPEDPKAE
jgi:Sec-independent protein translocase protein TatA